MNRSVPQSPVAPWRRFRRSLLGFTRSLALFLLVVVGGVTLFLILAPLFGYLPYSDRPGPGWYGRFPAMGWSEFWANGWNMLSLGIFLGIVFPVPGAAGMLLIRAFECVVRNRTARRSAATLIAALAAGFWMIGAGWYISAGLPLVVLASLLGAVTGGALLASPPWCAGCHAR